LNNEISTKTKQFYPPEVLKKLIKINSLCLAMNSKGFLPIDEALYRMQDLAFTLWDTEDKEENPIIQIYKIECRLR
jgi:hypothetical protein